eukprot:CAMPEP_0176052020 /NCGR_PEP_ID=MMETSP0120_2-20121206/25863_1 /TAXON_ID=160619 /ORGANISM="Kryptoperidinium foliaceum, Strain CCMP 1326" /LENGTH=177 /DNA_ID=CAMNT_0017385459 /DNA_START=57 /DNA_END=590 /DNA_ORIENTATION=+
MAAEASAMLAPKPPMHRFNTSGKKQKELTEEQKQDLKEFFDAYDADGSGSIDDKELKVMMRDMGLVLSTEELVAMILEVDEDGSGEMEFGEFCAMMKPKVLRRDPRDEIMKAFSLFTQDEGADRITYEHLRRLADELGEPFTDLELQEMVDEADKVGLGGVCREDFHDVMRRTGLWQ